MLGDLLRFAFARWPIILISATCCIGGGLWAAFTLPPRYVGSADVLMELVRPDPQTGEVVPSKMLEDYVGTQMRLAASPQTTRHMIRQFGWLNDPALQAEYAKTGEAIDGMEGWLAQRLSGAVSVSVPPESNLLRMSYIAPDPDNAKLLADALRAAFLTEAIDSKRRNASRDLAFFERQAVDALRRYSTALEARNTYAASRGIALTQNPNSERKLAEALLGRGTLSIQPEQARPAEVTRNGDAANQPPPPRAPVSGGDPHLETLKDQAELLRQRYLAVIARRNRAQQDTTTGDSILSAFGDATVTSEPVFPVYTKIIGGCLALGLILGIEIALLLELTRRRVRTEDDLAGNTDSDVLAVIRHRRMRRSSRRWLRRRFGDRGVRSKWRRFGGPSDQTTAAAVG